MWKNVNKTHSPSSPLDTKTQNTCVSESLATKSHDMKRVKINVRLMFGFRASSGTLCQLDMHSIPVIVSLLINLCVVYREDIIIY